LGFTIKQNTKVAVEKEVTEGTHVDPQSGAAFISPLSDGLEMLPAKEQLDRNNLNASIGKSTPRTGLKSVTGTIPVEMKSNGTEGAAPEFGSLIEACLGAERSAITKTSSDADDAGGNAYSDSIIRLADADANTFNIGDIVTTKRAGAYHTSPIASVNNTAGEVEIALLVADPAGAYIDGIDIAAVQTYLPANAGHPSLSVTKYVEDAVKETATGVRCTNMSLNNFTTGQLADMAFGFEGLSFDRALEAPTQTPVFDEALPPVILNACVFQDGVSIDVNEFTISVENTLGFITSTCSDSGKVSSRITERTVSGSINPYKQDDSITNFTKFNSNTTFSLFAYAYNPTGIDGEYEDVVAYYLPNCLTTEIAEADQDGVLQETLAFSANRGSDGSEEEIYISFT
jgi:hypothetical protein